MHRIGKRWFLLASGAVGVWLLICSRSPATSIAVVGGADGPTCWYITRRTGRVLATRAAGSALLGLAAAGWIRLRRQQTVPINGSDS